jgi:hypothetical protein
MELRYDLKLYIYELVLLPISIKSSAGGILTGAGNIYDLIVWAVCPRCQN